jgi:polo-like kinase 1
MIMNQNCYDFIYIKRENTNQKESMKSLTIHYDFSDYPESLKKKVILMQHFKSYLDGVKFEVPKVRPYPKEEYDMIFLKKWRRAKKAILFRLSNKVIQVIFQDMSELILSSGSGNVTFITSKREVRSTPLYVDLEKKDPSLFKRLNYAKEILVHMIHPMKAKEMPDNKENKYQRDGS